jgi:hypothetical protein
MRFGKLLVVEKAGHDKFKHIVWSCICDCGNTRLANGVKIRSGLIYSCGCHRHGHARAGKTSREYAAWAAMLVRCRNVSVPRYGGRGITVCERWNDFPAFLKDMGTRPSPWHSLDRINNDGNYEPSNCRWATRIEQGRNKSSNLIVVAMGKALPVSAWSEMLGIEESTLRRRIAHGMSPGEALSKPIRKWERHAS